MGKYVLSVWPQSQYRCAIYDNVPKYKRAKDVLKANPGAKGAINLALFAMVNYPAQGVKVYDHQADVKIAGKWEYGPRWLDVIGICIDKNGYAYAGKARDEAYEYAACKTVNYLNDKLETRPSTATNGLTYYAFKADGTMLTLLVSKDNPVSPATAVQTLRNAGAVTILEYDGSWSSQGAGPGFEMNPSQQRTCRTWLLFYPRTPQKEEPPMGTIMTKHGSYLAGKTFKPSGVMVHATGTPEANAMAIRDSWNKPTNMIGTHSIIDESGTYDLLPTNIRTAHCGGSANNTHLSFEICEFAETRLLPVNWVPLYQGARNMPTWAVKRWQEELKRRQFYTGRIDGSFGPATKSATERCQFNLGLATDGSVGKVTLAKAAEDPKSLMRYPVEALDKRFQVLYNRAVELTAKWCKEFKLDPMLQVIDHAEGYALGLASNHADTGHWFPQHGKNMDIFRKDVAAKMGLNVPTVPTPDYRAMTQKRFSFSEETMQHLSTHPFPAELFKRLATSV